MKVTFISCRDQYVRINEENIRPDFPKNIWKKEKLSDIQLIGNYEYDSVMHYDRCDATGNGWEVITAIVSQNISLLNANTTDNMFYTESRCTKGIW